MDKVTLGYNRRQKSEFWGWIASFELKKIVFDVTVQRDGLVWGVFINFKIISWCSQWENKKVRAGEKPYLEIWDITYGKSWKIV